jgi:hypothetical protein
LTLRKKVLVTDKISDKRYKSFKLRSELLQKPVSGYLATDPLFPGPLVDHGTHSNKLGSLAGAAADTAAAEQGNMFSRGSALSLACYDISQLSYPN